MDRMQDLLQRIAELAAPLAYQQGLDHSLRQEDVVYELERQKLHMELQLVDEGCDAAIDVLQRNAPSWAATCLWLRPRRDDVHVALRIVKLCEVTLMTPSLVAHRERLRRRCLRIDASSADDIRASVAHRLALVWREVRMCAVSAAVHHARGGRARLALSYSERAVTLLYGVGGRDIPMTALVCAGYDTDTKERRHTEQRRVAQPCRSTTAERIVSVLTSHAVLLRHAEKYVEGLDTARVAVQLAETLLDETRLRHSVETAAAHRGTGEEQRGDAAAVSAQFLLGLTLFNEVGTMAAVAQDAATRSIAVPAHVLASCAIGGQYKRLRRAREHLLLGSADGAHSRALVERIDAMLVDMGHRALPPPSAHHRKLQLALAAAETANDTLVQFQRIAGVLSQHWGAQRHRQQLPPPLWDSPQHERRGEVCSEGNDANRRASESAKWAPINPHATSLLVACSSEAQGCDQR